MKKFEISYMKLGKMINTVIEADSIDSAYLLAKKELPYNSLKSVTELVNMVSIDTIDIKELLQKTLTVLRLVDRELVYLRTPIEIPKAVKDLIKEYEQLRERF